MYLAWWEAKEARRTEELLQDRGKEQRNRASVAVLFTKIFQIHDAVSIVESFDSTLSPTLFASHLPHSNPILARELLARKYLVVLNLSILRKNKYCNSDLPPHKSGYFTRIFPSDDRCHLRQQMALRHLHIALVRH